MSKLNQYLERVYIEVDLSVGTKVRTSYGTQGIDPNEVMTIIKWEDQETHGNYPKADPKTHYAVQYKNGQKGFIEKKKVRTLGENV